MSTKAIQTDIETHKTVIDTLILTATNVANNSEPDIAKVIKSKMESIERRYVTISDITLRHGEDLRFLNGKLNDFEREVDKLEDWVLPTIEMLEAKDLMSGDVNQLNKKIKVGLNDESSIL